MIDIMMKRLWEDLKRGRFEWSDSLHCPECGTCIDDDMEPPGTERYVTLTCIYPDCRAEFDVIPVVGGGWLLRLRSVRVWEDFSEGPDWEESGGVDPPLPD